MAAVRAGGIDAGGSSCSGGKRQEGLVACFGTATQLSGMVRRCRQEHTSQYL